MEKIHYQHNSKRNFKFYLNDEFLSDIHVRGKLKYDKWYFQIGAPSLKASGKIGTCSIKDFGDLDSLKIKTKIVWLNFQNVIPVHIKKINESSDQLFSVKFLFAPDFARWSYSYSFSEYIDILSILINNFFIETGQQIVIEKNRAGFNVILTILIFYTV